MSDQAQPNWKLPLILSTVLAVVGGFAYWLQYAHKPKQDAADSKTKKPLLLPDDAQIAMLKIKSEKGLIELKCEELAQKKCKVGDEGKWSVTHPAPYPSDSGAVKEAISNAANVLATETIDLSGDSPEKRKSLLDEYGLSDAKRTDLKTQFIEFVLENGSRITGWFGVEHPLGDKTFVARSKDGVIDDSTIYLISNYFKNQFEKDLTHFRDKTIFNFDRSTIDGFIAVTAKNSNSINAKRVNGLWSLNGLSGDYSRIETLLSAISKVKAKDFPSEKDLAGARQTVKFELKGGGKTYTLALFEKTTKSKNPKAPAEKRYYVRTSEISEPREVEPLFESQINVKLSELRNTTLFTETEKVTATKVSVNPQGKGELQLKASDSKAKTLLEALAQSRIIAFDVKKAPKSKETLEVKIGDNKNDSKFHYLFWKINSQVYGNDLAASDPKVKNETVLLNDEASKGLSFAPESWTIAK